jgi:hypothetical protein
VLVAAFVVTAAASAQRQAVPNPMTGKWNRTVTAAMWAKAGRPGFAAGKWKIIVAKSGVLTVYAPEATSVDITAKLSGLPEARVQVTSFPSCKAAGTYRWRVAQAALTLTKVKDNCAGRAALLNGAWRKG